MAEDKDEPNVTRIVWSTHEPNVLHCKLVVDFTTPEGQELLRKINSPEGVDRMLDAAIVNCWLELPTLRRDAAMLDREMRSLLELTIENLHAHPQAFGISGDAADPLAEEFRNERFFGPASSLMLHSAVETCAKMLPAEQRALASIERELRSRFPQVLSNRLANLQSLAD